MRSAGVHLEELCSVVQTKQQPAADGPRGDLAVHLIEAPMGDDRNNHAGGAEIADNPPQLSRLALPSRRCRGIPLEDDGLEALVLPPVRYSSPVGED
jgi:hypothetical protein